MARTIEFQSIDLRGRVIRTNTIEFLRVDVPTGDFRAPFAVVRYSEHGEEQRYGIRLDLDKRAFLDHFDDDPEKETILRVALPQIIAVVQSDLSMIGVSNRYLLAEGALPDETFEEEREQGPDIVYELSHPPLNRGVAITCSSKDIEWADMLSHYLLDALHKLRPTDIRCFDDEFAEAKDWEVKLIEGLSSAKVIIVLVSRSLFFSPLRSTGMLPFTLEEARNTGSVILPVLVDPIPTHELKWIIPFPEVTSYTMPLKELSRSGIERTLYEVVEYVESALNI